MQAWERPEEFPRGDAAMPDFAEALAGGRQGGLLADPGGDIDRADEAGAGVRSRGGRGFCKAAADSPLSVAGPALAAEAFSAGLVDELQLFVAPVIVGGGTRSLPDGVRLDLELVEERRFAGGMAYLRYRTR